MKKYEICAAHRVNRLAAAGAIMLLGLQLAACGKYTEKEIAVSAGSPAEETGQLRNNQGGDLLSAGAIDITTASEEAGTVDAPAEVPEETSSISAVNDTEAETAASTEAGNEDGGTSVTATADTPAEVPVETVSFAAMSGMEMEDAAAFVRTFADAVTSGDRESAAAMISFPRKVKTPDWEGTVNSPEEFLTYYDQIFTEDFRKGLENAPLDDLFCSNGLISFGPGSLWFYPASGTSDMSVCTVNAAEDRYVRYGGPAGVQPG